MTHAKTVRQLTRLLLRETHLVLLALVVHLAEARHAWLLHVSEERVLSTDETPARRLQDVVADIHLMKLRVHAVTRLRLQTLLSLLLGDGRADVGDARVRDVV